MINVNLVQIECKECGRYVSKWKPNLTLCGKCDPLAKKKIQEEEVFYLLEKHDYIFIHDKVIRNQEIHKYRPDFLLQFDTYYLILEVDERGHKAYKLDHEEHRMHCIRKSLDMPVKFIRYNPDHKDSNTDILLETLKIESSRTVLTDTDPIYLFY